MKKVLIKINKEYNIFGTSCQMLPVTQHIFLDQTKALESGPSMREQIPTP